MKNLVLVFLVLCTAFACSTSEQEENSVIPTDKTYSIKVALSPPEFVSFNRTNNNYFEGQYCYFTLRSESGDLLFDSTPGSDVVELSEVVPGKYIIDIRIDDHIGNCMGIAKRSIEVIDKDLEFNMKLEPKGFVYKINATSEIPSDFTYNIRLRTNESVTVTERYYLQNWGNEDWQYRNLEKYFFIETESNPYYNIVPTENYRSIETSGVFDHIYVSFAKYDTLNWENSEYYSWESDLDQLEINIGDRIDFDIDIKTIFDALVDKDNEITNGNQVEIGGIDWNDRRIEIKL
ncbi:hypothetical protein [Flammeovirga sp. SJP92]|uniref:hypothetical protein n=1 Tax=Flammeovirga sp. SJP92 TaxID=1775430 RepID=UPI000788177E|nr:hypothetical protein [Flammeovirga sp. SJP92]KXX71349.1 hypothetical protein AVL50_06995 [Flammeovirga sp. SJP92]